MIIMAPVNMEKTKQMQDEMDRFEAEILSQVGQPGAARMAAGGNRREIAPPPPPPSGMPSGRQMRPEMRQLAPPPPPPRNMFMPAQLLRPRNLAPPPPPPSNFMRPGPGPMHFQPGPQNFQPMMGQMYGHQQQFHGGMMPMGPIGPMAPENESSAVQSEPAQLVISGAPQRYGKPKDTVEVEQPEPLEKKAKSTEIAPEKDTSEAKSKPSVSGSGATTSKSEKQSKKKQKKFVRVAGGQVWEDTSLQDWDPSDYRIFCGDLGNDVTDEVLARIFGRYPSFQKARVIRDKRSNKTKGFGFVSFKDPQDFIRAMKEVNGKYVGSRPIKLRKSDWRKRNIEEVKKKEKEKVLLGM